MMKFVGKPYAGKLHVRIDEGAGKAMCPSRSTLLNLCETKKVTQRTLRFHGATQRRILNAMIPLVKIFHNYLKDYKVHL